MGALPALIFGIIYYGCVFFRLKNPSKKQLITRIVITSILILVNLFIIFGSLFSMSSIEDGSGMLIMTLLFIAFSIPLFLILYKDIIKYSSLKNKPTEPQKDNSKSTSVSSDNFKDDCYLEYGIYLLNQFIDEKIIQQKFKDYRVIIGDFFESSINKTTKEIYICDKDNISEDTVKKTIMKLISENQQSLEVKKPIKAAPLSEKDVVSANKKYVENEKFSEENEELYSIKKPAEYNLNNKRNKEKKTKNQIKLLSIIAIALSVVLVVTLIFVIPRNKADKFELVKSITITTDGESKTFSSSTKPQIKLSDGEYIDLNEFADSPSDRQYFGFDFDLYKRSGLTISNAIKEANGETHYEIVESLMEGYWYQTYSYTSTGNRYYKKYKYIKTYCDFVYVNKKNDTTITIKSGNIEATYSVTSYSIKYFD